MATTADYILKILIDVNSEKVERVIQAVADQVAKETQCDEEIILKGAFPKLKIRDELSDTLPLLSQADLDWYGMINAKIGIRNRLFVDNDPPEKVVNRIITEYGLKDI